MGKERMKGQIDMLGRKEDEGADMRKRREDERADIWGRKRDKSPDTVCRWGRNENEVADMC